MWVGSFFLQLAKKYHPDTNKSADAKEKFVQIQEAYDVCVHDTICLPS